MALDDAKILQKGLEFLTAFCETLLLDGENDLSSEGLYQKLGLDK